MLLKRLKVNAAQAIDNSDLVIKADYDTKIVEIEKIIPDHDKYITTQEINTLPIRKYFTEKLKQPNLESKNDIADFVKISKKVKLNKIRYVEVKKKPNGHTISYAKLINEILEEVKQI